MNPVRWTIGLLILLLVHGAAAFAQSPQVLHVVGDESYAPFEMAAPGGACRGVFPDIWRLWSEKTGFSIDYQCLKWAEALKRVREGRADVVGGIFQSPERLADFDFTHPHLTIETTIFFHQTIFGLRTVEDLRGFRVGVVREDTAETYLRQRLPGDGIAAYDGNEALVRAAIQGEVRVFVADTPVALFYLAKQGADEQFRRALDPLYTNRVHAAVRKGNTKLLETINRGFTAVGAKEIAAVQEKWIGAGGPAAIPWAYLGALAGLFTLIVLAVVRINRRLRVGIARATRDLEESRAQLQSQLTISTVGGEIGRLLTMERPMDQTLAQCTQVLVNHLAVDFGVIWVTGQIGADLVAEARTVTDPHGDAFPPPASRVVRELTPLLGDRTTLALSGRSMGADLAAALGTPTSPSFSVLAQVLVVDGARIGGAALIHRGEFPGAATAALAAAADRIAVGIHGRRAEETLRKEKEGFQTLLEEAPLGVTLLDADGRTLYLNRRFTRIFNCDLEDIPNLTAWFRLALPDENERFRVETEWHQILRTAQTGHTHTLAFPVRGRDGSIHPARFTAVLLGDGHWLIMSEDISRHVEKEEELRRLEGQLYQSQKMEAVGTLTSGIAHDFNNLLQAISGYIQLLQRRGQVGDDGLNYLGQMDRAVRRASELARRLLNFSRKGEPRLMPVDLNKEIRQTAQLLERTIPRDVMIETRLTEESTAILADPNQLEQVVVNLVTNARDAMPEGGRITIETETVSIEPDSVDGRPGMKPGRWVRLKVTDTGHGMDAATRERVFEPFFTTKRAGEGTGLGLSTAYGIVKAHGGFIDCDSEPGQGTRFTLWWPGDETQARTARPERSGSIPAPAAGERPRPPAAIQGAGETILVVDDEPALRNIARMMLEEAGYQVLTAESGEEALVIQKNRPDLDLVMLDLGMPGMGGHKCLKSLLDRSPDLKVIIATGYVAERMVQPALDAGAKGVIVKPFREEVLLETVRRTLAGGSSTTTVSAAPPEK
jgi:PAS domain S-box-containing protein